MKRKTDNTPVTDESLARVRDEIAEAYSHASHETDSLIAALDAGDMANVIAREKEFVSREAYDAVVKERDDLRLYAAQCSLNADNANISLGCACEELKENRLRSQFDESVALLREALRDCINHAGPCAGSTTGECIEAFYSRDEGGLCPSCAVTEIASLALALADGAK